MKIQFLKGKEVGEVGKRKGHNICMRYSPQRYGANSGTSSHRPKSKIECLQVTPMYRHV